MDNLQFWLYVAFAIIYFIVKQVRKKKPNDIPQDGEPQPYEPQRKPVTFDELLKEFTQEKAPVTEKEDVLYEKAQTTVTAPSFDENRDQRRFADDESRQIYEQSISQAEGYDLKFERDDHFTEKKPITISKKEEEEEKSAGQEIFESLQDVNAARKAIILSEILNRKY